MHELICTSSRFLDVSEQDESRLVILSMYELKETWPDLNCGDSVSFDETS